MKLLKEYWPLLLIIVAFILVRTINFTEHLNFSADQGLHASKSFELWRDKKIELLGPSASFKIGEKSIFFGSITYYFQLLFLLPARFDPLISSYLFMLFSSFLTIFLFFGTKMLSDKKTAYVVTSLYAFLPWYIQYTGFLWNPNFQLALSPFLIFLLGLYNIYAKKIIVFLIGLFAGLLLMFHYSFIFVILGLGIYLVFFKRISFIEVVIWLVGLAVGFSPMILFELRNNFYTLRTILELFTLEKSTKGYGITIHYFLLIIFFMLCVCVICLRRVLSMKVVIFISVVLFIFALFYSTQPQDYYKAKKSWNYKSELKVYEYIRKDNLQNYNIANLAYDTLAQVQKYFHLKDNMNLDRENYTTNMYLYVIADSQKNVEKGPYEVSSIKPYEIVSVRKINEGYNLYLLKRISNNTQ